MVHPRYLLGRPMKIPQKATPSYPEDEEIQFGQCAAEQLHLPTRERACRVRNYGTPNVAAQLATFFLLCRLLNRDIAMRIMQFNPTYTQQDRGAQFEPNRLRILDNAQGCPILRSHRIRIPSSSGGPVQRVKRVAVEVTGHDQGWADFRPSGSWTWYRVALVRPTRLGGREVARARGPSESQDSIEQAGRGDDGNNEPSTFVDQVDSHLTSDGEDEYEVKWILNFARNAIADKTHQTHSFAFDWDEAGTKYLSEIEDGDFIEIRAAARFAGWVNHVYGAKIMIDLVGI